MVFGNKMEGNIKKTVVRDVGFIGTMFSFKGQLSGLPLTFDLMGF